MRRNIQSRTLILVEDSLNAFHHGQWLLRSLFLRLLQRAVAVVAFRKPTLRTVLSKSRKDDRSKIGRRTAFLARYQQRSRSKATRELIHFDDEQLTDCPSIPMEEVMVEGGGTTSSPSNMQRQQTN